MSNEEKCKKLMERSYACLDSYDTNKALKLGKELISLNYSGGYEILALAYAQDNLIEKAINVLEDGLAKVPHVWVLWQMLGNFQSDLCQYEKADQAYKKAIDCPFANAASVKLNMAINLERQERFVEAIDLCQELSGTDVRLQGRALQASLFNSLREHDKAIATANLLISDLMTGSHDDTNMTYGLSNAYLELGRAYWEGKKNKDAALESILKALRFNKTHEYALQIYREIQMRESKESKLFYVVVEGELSAPFEGENYIPKFYASFDVTADTPDECLMLIKELEPADIQKTIKIKEIEEKGSDSNCLKGIYFRSGYMFFDESGDDESCEPVSGEPASGE